MVSSLEATLRCDEASASRYGDAGAVQRTLIGARRTKMGIAFCAFKPPALETDFAAECGMNDRFLLGSDGLC